LWAFDVPAALSVDTEDRFEKAWGIFELAIFALMVLALIAGLAGLAGRGPLANGSHGLAGAQIRYDRFPHRGALSQIEVQAPASATGLATVELSRDLTARMDIKMVAPSPLTTTSRLGAQQYQLRVDPRVGGQITIQIQPRKVGRSNGTITVNSAPLPIKQFIYP
jgi:hypothetical protein